MSDDEDEIRQLKAAGMGKLGPDLIQKMRDQVAANARERAACIAIRDGAAMLGAAAVECTAVRGDAYPAGPLPDPLERRGEQQTADVLRSRGWTVIPPGSAPAPATIQPAGCVCPADAPANCQAVTCPRKNPFAAAAR